MKRNIYIFALLLATQSLWAQSGNWSDQGNRDTDWASDYESASAFTISTPAQLAQLAYQVNNNSKPFSGKTITLTSDIDLSAHAWTPIGTQNIKYFDGNFDGNGHTISGASVILETGRAGIFGTLKGGTIRNLTVSNSTFNSPGTCGSIVACIPSGDGVVENCHVTSDVTVGNTTSPYKGGVVGSVEKGNITITGCTSDATVTGSRYVGGIVGTSGVANSTEEYTINICNCFYYGNSVTATIEDAGSIVGRIFYDTHKNVFTVLTNNYYPSTTTGLMGVGYKDSEYELEKRSNFDETRNNGAVRVRVVTTDEDIADMGEITRTYTDGATIYTSGLAFGGKYYSHVLSLSNNADNSDLLDELDGQIFDVKLRGRTLYRDGSWNTLCLPFSLASFENIDIFPNANEYEVRAFDTTGQYKNPDIDNYYHVSGLYGDRILLNFKNSNSIDAGKPYLVKWTVEGYNPLDPSCDYHEPVFKNVTINKTPVPVTTQDGSVTFTPTYDPVVYDYEDRSVLFIGSGNSLYYPNGAGSTTIGSCRAYFQLNNGLHVVDAEDDNPGGGGVKIYFIDSETEDGIIDIEHGTWNMEHSAGAVYNLNGQRLSRPLKGTNIINGKKILF